MVTCLTVWGAAVGAVWLAVSSGAALQPETVTAGGVKWTPTEPLVGDMNPVGVSQRAMPTDLRVGSNFDRLYRLDARPRFFGGEAERDYYMRMNGGVMAIFPRSSYVMRRDVLTPEVPPGTVFSIGGDVHELVNMQPEERRSPGNNFVDRSAKPGAPTVDRPQPAPPARPDPPGRPDNHVPREGQPGANPAAPPEPKAAALPSEPVGPSIWWDEPYRHQRISELLDRALAGE